MAALEKQALNNARVKRHFARRRAQGDKIIQFWASETTREQLKELMDLTGQTQQAVIAIAVGAALSNTKAKLKKS